MARVLEAGRNRASPDEAASFVQEYDRLEQVFEVKAAELDAEFKQKKRSLRKATSSEQAAILADAKKQGVKKGVIRALADGMKKTRKADEAKEKAEARAEELLEALEDDDKAFAVDIREALSGMEDTPLGQAAIEREEGEQDPTTKAIVDIASKEWDEADPAKQTEPAE